MLKVKPKGFLAITFLLMIGLVPLFYLVSIPFPRVNSMTEGRVMKRFTLEGLGFKSALDVFQDGDKARAVNMGFKLVLNRALPGQIELATSDQFPLRDLFIKSTFFFGRKLNDLVYARSPMPAIPATIEPDTGLYLMRDGSGYFYSPALFNQTITELIDTRVTNYQEIIGDHPEINLYLYHIDTISSSPINPLNDYFYGADKGQSFQYFLDRKPENLKVGNLALTSFEDHLRNFYRTDGHWNIHGALAAYDGIYELLSGGFPDISEKLTFGPFITFPGVKFIGGYGRQSMYPVDGEVFEVVEYKLPPYKTYLDGSEITYGHSADYFTNKYSVEPFVNHYWEFFGANFGFVDFESENQSTRNVLVFGDSFDNPLLPLISSHYHHTYSVDLRDYGKFSLKDFMVDNSVDDILIIGTDKLSFISPDWIINP